MSELLRHVIDYHEASKHHYNRYARGPGYLDWRNQPDPFRRYPGASVFHLDTNPRGSDPAYDSAFTLGQVPCAAFDAESLSRFLLDSLAVSAWKRAGSDTWALRVNPSSGNLHPTEGYLIFGPVEGVSESPVVCHYAPKEHALEVRARFPLDLWRKLIEGFPEDTILAGLTSIHWREAWKYGARAYRYCQHDVGHALASLGIAAGGLGRQTRLLDDLSTEDISSLLGVFDQQGEEAEYAECLLAVYPQNEGISPPSSLDLEAIAHFRDLSWQGRPNRLSAAHLKWPAIDKVALACRKVSTEAIAGKACSYANCSETDDLTSAGPRPSIRPLGLHQVVRQRRSAVEMDGITSIPCSVFFDMLRRTIPGPKRIPFLTLPWEANVHLALFVHRVDGLPKGLYFLARDSRKKDELRSAMREDFLWEKPAGCPDDLELYILAETDVRKTSVQVSCFQDLAGDGCFSAAMIASFMDSLNRYGPWFYPRLFWECGMIGQVLYLEAEAAGVRGTGMGCFFDDPTHEVLGLKDAAYQDLYHFTVGGPVEDPRLSTLPAYPEANRASLGQRGP